MNDNLIYDEILAIERAVKRLIELVEATDHVSDDKLHRLTTVTQTLGKAVVSWGGARK